MGFQCSQGKLYAPLPKGQIKLNKQKSMILPKIDFFMCSGPLKSNLIFFSIKIKEILWYESLELKIVRSLHVYQ